MPFLRFFSGLARAVASVFGMGTADAFRPASFFFGDFSDGTADNDQKDDDDN